MIAIKFRGKRVDNRGWLHGDLRIINSTFYWICDNDFERIVIPETVGQFTGLIDLNGKEIYEGDLLSANFVSAKNLKAIHCIMTFNEATACFEAQQYWASQDKWLSLSSGHNYYLYEIIGNIHENT